MIHSQRFDNGLTVLAETQAWQPGVSFELHIPAGAINEAPDLLGSSTVLESWLYRGAGSRDSRALSDAFDDLGLRRSGGAGLEGMTLAGSLLAADLPAALELIADVVRRPILPSQDFESCRDLARQDLAGLEDAPAQKMFVLLRERFFQGPHGRSVLGSLAGLEALSPAKLRADHKRRCTPDGAVLAVAGGVDWQTLLGCAEVRFADWQGPPAQSAQPVMQGGFYQHVMHESHQEQIGLMFPDVAAQLEPESFGWYESRLALNAFSGMGFSSRLMQEVREKRGLVYSVSASGSQLRGAGFVTAYAGTTPERAEETLRVMLEEFDRLKDGLQADEFERSRTSLLTGLVMSEESSAARARSLVRDQLLLGRVRSAQAVQAGVRAVTLQGVNAWLKKHPYRNPAVMTLGTKSLELAAPSP